MLRSENISFTTDSAGDVTVYSGPFVGLIHGIFYDYGDAATGADFTITDDVSGQAIITVTNAGTSDVLWLPRAATHDTSAAASLYAAGGEPVEDRIPVYSRVKIVVAQGGDAKTGVFHISWDDG